MSKHPTNKNLNIIKQTSFKNLPLIKPKGNGNFEFIEEYLDSNLSVINNALNTHPRTLAVRVDLHFPKQVMVHDYPNKFQEGYITRFIKSLKSKILSYIMRTSRNGKRTHHSSVKYIWTCESGNSKSKHYHLVLFLNNHTFRHPGVKNSSQSPSNLINMIVEAWASSLHIEYYDAWKLVTIPPSASYCLRNDIHPNDNKAYCALFERLSYFAKVKTKVYGSNLNSYGCSRIRKN